MSNFGDKDKLDQKALEDLYGKEMARKILDGKPFTTRPALREQLMYLLYFGIGTDPAQHIKKHLNGRTARASSSRDVALNHFVTKSKVVRTCIFEARFSHNAGKIEQAGIEFVTTTDKHTNVRRSNGATKHNVEHMSYYMILVLDPDFSVEEIRNAKLVRNQQTNHTKSFASSRNRKRSRSDEEWDGEVKGKGKGPAAVVALL